MEVSQHPTVGLASIKRHLTNIFLKTKDNVTNFDDKFTFISEETVLKPPKDMDEYKATGMVIYLTNFLKMEKLF